MLWFKRFAALMVGGFALCAALLTSGVATASAAPIEGAASPAAVNPCGFSWGGLWGTSMYDNCSPYSVGIRVEWWGHGDTYQCVPAHATVALNGYDQTPPYYADYDGVRNCRV